ncbi:response regulator transcription factor [Peptoniphilus sp. SGI.035]|uniref:response regulator transcription factor n=1 Tax=Peptoniphilus sp. SGI.035 TaxID=3420564 RepID=UPI003D009643
MKILMIEDDNTIAFAVETYLKKYDIETIVYDKLSSLENINFSDFDLILLDANLPDGSGFDFLKWLREFSDIPTIMLTVKNEDQYVVKGLSQGADDYITKPFSLPILKARIDNVFRRKVKKTDTLIFKDLTLDFTSKSATIAGVNIDLNLKEFSVLEILLENQDINLLRERILDYVWGYDLYEVNDNTLTVTIKRLRSKLGRYGKHIKTVRGIGYRWDNDLLE